MLRQFWRHARRLFTHNPALSAAAVLALAAGIAGNAALFSLVNSLLLRPLPYPEPERLISIMGSLQSDPGFRTTVSVPDFLDWKAQSRTLENWCLYQPREVSAIVHGGPITIRAAYVSSGLLALTKTRAFLGSIPSANDPIDPTRVAVSYQFWKDRLSGDPNVIGRSIAVESSPRHIIAVMPPGFNIGSTWVQGDMWIPMPLPMDNVRGDHELWALARLRPGVSLHQAQAEMSRIAGALAVRYPDADGGFTVALEHLQQFLARSVSGPLLTLLVAVLLVQLIVCSNVAGLLLSRGAERSQETAIRIALGASLGDIAVQCLAEGLALSLTGCALGLALAPIVLKLRDWVNLTIPLINPVRIDWTVVGWTFLLSILTGVLASFAPWWQARFIRSGDLLKEGSRTTASLARRRLLRAFAGVEIALSLVLLIGTGLLGGRLQTAVNFPLGFDPNNLYSVRIIVPKELYPKREALTAFYDQVLQRARGSQELHDPSLISLLTPDWGMNSTLYPDGKELARLTHQYVEFRFVSKSYFRLMNLRPLQGRLPSEQDVVSTGSRERPMPVVLNESAARLGWPQGNALGSRFFLGVHDRWLRVAAIVRDIRNATPESPTRPEADFLYAGHDAIHMLLVVRSQLPQATVNRLLRRAVISTDPGVSVAEAQSMNHRLDESLSRLRFQTVLLSMFSSFALLLAVVGVYSVMSYSVSQRAVEIGIRSALGADPFRTLRLILWDGLKLAFVATLAGVAVAFALVELATRFSIAEIHLEPMPVISSCALIVVASVVACFLPARRAAMVDPMVALRPETPISLRTTLRRLRALPKLLHLPVSRSKRTTDFDRQWIAELAGATERAASISDVLNAALTQLRTALGAASAVLFVRSAGDWMLCAAADQLPDSASVKRLAVQSFLARRLRNVLHPITLGDRDFAAWEHFARTAEPHIRGQREEEIATLRATGAVLFAPVWLRGDLLGVLAFGPRNPDPYTSEDLEALQVAGTQLAFVIENGRLLERIAAEERTRQELALAARVQRRLFPEKPLEAAQIELAGECQPARTIGGDYYDFLELPSGQIGIALADVAGKGIAAALLTSVIQASVRSLAPDRDRTLSSLVGRINQLLFNSTESNSYATFFYAQFDPNGCRLNYVNAGHNPPYFLRIPNDIEAPAHATSTQSVGTLERTAVQELAATGPIIGLLQAVSYEEDQIALHPGDLLVVFTDGIPEALNADEEEYGEERLRELVASLHGQTADNIRQAVLNDVRAFIGPAPQYDDMTVLVLRVR